MRRDTLIHGQLKDYPVRFFCADTTKAVEDLRQIHLTTPTATAAAGRLTTAAALMGAMMKNETDRLTLIVKGDGPIGQMVVTANKNAQVKCDIAEPCIDVFVNSAGKLDVAKAVGAGTLTVIRDTGYSEPYNSTVRLANSEIGEDVAYYYALSEQIPTVCALGVFVNKEGNVQYAGGYILQLMPSCPEEMVAYLEQKVKELPSVTEFLKARMQPEEIIGTIFDDGQYAYDINRTLHPQYYCDCSKERVQSMLTTLDAKEIEDMVKNQQGIEVKCHFCNHIYNFDTDNMEKIKKLKHNINQE